MLIKEGRETVGVECNGCGSVEPIGAESFREFIDRLKAEGWRIRKDEEDEWVHSCPECCG